MTDYALSAYKPRELSLGHRLLLWIEKSQQRKADREISRVPCEVRD